MRVWIAASIVCLGVVSTGIAPAAPRTNMDDLYRTAVQLDQEGDYRQSLAVIDQALANAPRRLDLLFLRIGVLVSLGDRTGAMAACDAFLKAGARGGNRVHAAKLRKELQNAQPTSIAISVANGPADVRFDYASKPACTAAPSCTQVVSHGRHRVIVERPGFDRWTGNVTVAKGSTASLAITLVEKPSQITVRAPADAVVMVDGVVYRKPIHVAAGAHRVTASLARHRDEQRAVVAHEGAPIELDVALTPLVPVHISPASATLSIDDTPVAIETGGIALPPGPQKLMVRAPGFVARTVDIAAERPAEITVELQRPPPPPPDRFPFRRKIALASLGVGLAAGATGVTLGIQSRQRDHDARALCPSPAMPCSEAPVANALNQQARQRASQANVAYGAAGAAAVAAVILWLTAKPESGIAIAPQVGPGAGTGVSVAGRF